MTTTDTDRLRERALSALGKAHDRANSVSTDLAIRELDARIAVTLAQYAEVLLRIAADEDVRAAKGGDVSAHEAIPVIGGHYADSLMWTVTNVIDGAVWLRNDFGTERWMTIADFAAHVADGTLRRLP